MREVIAEIKDTVSDDEIIVSIAPGKSLSWFDEMFGKSLKGYTYHAKYTCHGW